VGKLRLDADKWLDVAWETNSQKRFKVDLRLSVANVRGMLAQITAGMADADADIDNVSTDDNDSGMYTNVYFTVQVRDRVHLADLIRHLRKIPDVVRINRAKGAK
jgi:GTP pyrophosphokinase